MILRALALLLALPLAAAAATGPAVEGPTATMRLLAAEDGVAPGAGAVSAGLEVALKDGWKTYWRSAGEIGLPPEIDWTGSENVASAELLYPAPTRFTAFEIENFGYSGTVLFPVRITLADPGAPARLRAEARLLVCAEICVPEVAELTLDLPAGSGVDAGSAALIAAAADRVPTGAEAAGLILRAAHLSDEALTLEVAADPPLVSPDVFPEAGRAGFGAPDVRLADGGRTFWARLPVTVPPSPIEITPIDLTIVDGARAATFPAPESDAPPAPPSARTPLLAALLAAFVGGLILNVMPCVLPVLTIKLAGAVAGAGQSAARVRAGFLASAAGVMSFALILAAIVIAARAAGLSVGWGVQFQSPVFLAALVLILALFAASLAGAWEAALPSSWQTALAQGRGGLAGDFAAGAFAAVLATPCSAPFLGTAVAVAFAAQAPVTLAVFAALGLGLAAPYLLVAARPTLVAKLPRPGRWMVWVKAAMAALLVATALWLLWVMARGAGLPAALLTGALVMAAALAPLLRRFALPAVAALALGAVVAPLMAPMPAARASAAAGWEPFERAAIAGHIAAGRVVFVDVTADWCLTCKANKVAVLDREPVADLLAAEGTVPMVADWTRPDPAITDYLAAHGRAGIPLNVVYGPGAPGGIALPELLTTRQVVDALAAAR